MLFRLFMAALATGASICGNFSDDEIRLIGSDGDALMHVLTVDNPGELDLLRTPSHDLDCSQLDSETFAVLCARMLKTVNDPSHPGVGIAAPQVGVLKRVIAVQRFDLQDEPFVIYVNPRIEEYGVECSAGAEGCLSVPDLSGVVFRADSIVITCMDLASRMQVRETVTGFTAVIFQHEIDHLDGILFTDRVEDPDDAADRQTDAEADARALPGGFIDETH